jgi:D-alanyl-D-alanine carboxypeptidase
MTTKNNVNITPIHQQMVVLFLQLASMVNAISVAQLQSSVSQILANQPANEHWGVSASVFDPSSSTFVPILFANEDQFFQPASSNKLLATSQIYRVLGSNFSFATTFTADSADTLCIRSSGDPSVQYADLRRAASQINASGRTFKNLAVDKSFHRGIESYPDSWEMGDLAYDYGAAPTALIVNENVASFTVVAGSKLGDRPTLQFDESLEDGVFQFENNIITVVSGTTRITPNCFPFQKGIVLKYKTCLFVAVVLTMLH